MPSSNPGIVHLVLSPPWNVKKQNQVAESDPEAGIEGPSVEGRATGSDKGGAAAGGNEAAASRDALEATLIRAASEARWVWYLSVLLRCRIHLHGMGVLPFFWNAIVVRDLLEADRGPLDVLCRKFYIKNCWFACATRVSAVRWRYLSFCPLPERSETRTVKRSKLSHIYRYFTIRC